MSIHQLRAIGSQLSAALGHNEWSLGRMLHAFKSMERGFGHLSQRRTGRDDTEQEVTIEGEASAFGVDTLATAKVKATIKDYAWGSVSYGFADFRAAAEGEDSFAFVDTFVEVEGADIVVTATRTTTGRNFQVEKSYFYAIDLDWIDLSENPIVFNRETERTTRRKFNVEDGNKALADFDVAAIAENSFVDVTTDVLALEDLASLSIIEAFATIA